MKLARQDRDAVEASARGLSNAVLGEPATKEQQEWFAVLQREREIQLKKKQRTYENRKQT